MPADQIENTIARIKQLIVRALNLQDLRPDEIETDAPLFGEGLGLDSVDALELVVAIEKEFGIDVKDRNILIADVEMAYYVVTQHHDSL